MENITISIDDDLQVYNFSRQHCNMYILKTIINKVYKKITFIVTAGSYINAKNKYI